MEYIPGEAHSSRLAGNWNHAALAFFFGSLVVAAAFVYRLAREAHEPVRGRRRVGTHSR